MAEVNHGVTSILHILPLVLQGRLDMNVFQYVRFPYTIRTEGYKWDSTLDKVVPIGIDNSLEEIDRHWIQYTDDFTIRSKHYKK